MNRTFLTPLSILLSTAVPALASNIAAIAPAPPQILMDREGGGRIAAYVITVTGTCPGVMNLAWSGGPPNTQQGLLFALNTGNFVIPNNFTCAGTPTGLGTNQIQLVTSFATGALGSGNMNFNVPPFACGGFIQLVGVVTPCATSNVWGPL